MTKCERDWESDLQWNERRRHEHWGGELWYRKWKDKIIKSLKEAFHEGSRPNRQLYDANKRLEKVIDNAEHFFSSEK